MVPSPGAPLPCPLPVPSLPWLQHGPLGHCGSATPGGKGVHFVGTVVVQLLVLIPKAPWHSAENTAGMFL